MSSKIIRTVDPQMKGILDIVENIAPSRASVLIQGESGTGKELLARYIHTKSNRASKPFVAMNCAALPEGLLESELFGYEKGAFTGAEQRKIGKFESAHQGTFLLDEISELPLVLQSKLLRFLQEGEIERVGGLKPIKVDVRIIAASNKKVLDLVREHKFREDLFYRLNVIPIEIPPLRNRPLDLDLLSEFFVETSCAANGLVTKDLDEEARKKIHQWPWPGNVRELQNVIERSVLLTIGDKISADDIKIEGFEQPVQNLTLHPGMTVEEAERLLILKTLEYTAQNRTHAAQMLGISIRTLRNKINEYKMETVFSPLSERTL